MVLTRIERAEEVRAVMKRNDGGNRSIEEPTDGNNRTRSVSACRG